MALHRELHRRLHHAKKVLLVQRPALHGAEVGAALHHGAFGHMRRPE